MRILWISPFAPYDTVGHGGGQNHNYYLKYVKKHTDFDITLVSVCEADEFAKLDLDQYGIKNIVRVYDRKKIITKIQDAWGKLCLIRDGGLLNYGIYVLLLSAIREYVSLGKRPDVIITQWTEATLMYKTLRHFFPDSKYIAIEEDVAYLGYKRKYECASGLYKLYKKLKYTYLKKAEIRTLLAYDVVVALNVKDEELLVSAGVPHNKILRMCSYHGFYPDAKYNPNLNQLLFYGAMSRKENYLSAIWFIENVMSKLSDSYTLVIVGSNPPEKLLKYQCNRIVITGFVESIRPYFEQSLCLVSPLLLGAGIKIKVLEALSAGLPVITNRIGAEGVSLTSGENYIHCETADDYVGAINDLCMDAALRAKLSNNGKAHVLKEFDVNAAIETLIQKIQTYEE